MGHGEGMGMNVFGYRAYGWHQDTTMDGTKANGSMAGMVVMAAVMVGTVGRISGQSSVISRQWLARKNDSPFLNILHIQMQLKCH